jgi:hypothetical protein
MSAINTVCQMIANDAGCRQQSTPPIRRRKGEPNRPGNRQKMTGRNDSFWWKPPRNV